MAAVLENSSPAANGRLEDSHPLAQYLRSRGVKCGSVHTLLATSSDSRGILTLDHQLISSGVSTGLVDNGSGELLTATMPM